jgi:hypothetical protein
VAKLHQPWPTADVYFQDQRQYPQDKGRQETAFAPSQQLSAINASGTHRTTVRNSCKSLIDTIHGGCITRTTDCWRIIPAGKSLVVQIYCLKIRSSISSSSCKEIFQLSMSAYTICRSRPTVSKGSWSNQTENLTISYLAYIPCLHKACKKNTDQCR